MLGKEAHWEASKALFCKGLHCTVLKYTCTFNIRNNQCNIGNRMKSVSVTDLTIEQNSF